MTLDATAPAPATRRPDLWAILAIALVATLVRVWHLGSASVWFDEIASLQLSTSHGPGDVEPPMDVIHRDGMVMTSLDRALSWSHLPKALSIDTHPVLYPAILRLWRGVFGAGDRAARSLSLVCSVVSILILYDVVRMLHGTCAGLWAAAIMAVATPQIFFAQETRSYAMLTLLLLTVIREIARAQARGEVRAIPLMLLTLAAAMTHYLAIPAELALGFFVLIQFRGKQRQRTLASMAASAALFLLLCGPLLWQQRNNFSQNLDWLSDTEPGLLMRTFQRLGQLPLQYYVALSNADSRSAAMALLGASFYVLIPFALLRRRDLLIWIAPLVAIIGAAAVSDLHQHRRSLTELRMTVAAAPAMYALIAAFAGSLPRSWMRHAVPAAIVACCAIYVPEAHLLMPKPGDYRKLAAQFDAEASANDVVVIPHQSVPTHWYNSLALSGMTHYSQHPSRPVLPLSRPIYPEMLEEVRAAPAVWLLNAGSAQPNDPWIPGATMVKSVAVFGTASLSKLQLPSAGPTSAPAESSPASQSSR